jgi:ribosomal protein L33
MSCEEDGSNVYLHSYNKVNGIIKIHFRKYIRVSSDTKLILHKITWQRVSIYGRKTG